MNTTNKQNHTIKHSNQRMRDTEINIISSLISGLQVPLQFSDLVYKKNWWKTGNGGNFLSQGDGGTNLSPSEAHLQN